jgi:hypothetical protein
LVPFAITAWLWAGRPSVVKVTDSSPAAEPSGRSLRPGPCPDDTATLPRRSGTANVTLPSPPYVVPSSEKRGEFSAIESSRPSQGNQPTGVESYGKS